MKHLDLFSGIGGFALAARWVGFETVAFCEIDPFCQKVLRKNFGEEIVIHNDIRKLDGSQYQNIGLLTGGFPCQPYSIAGKRLGAQDPRALWPEMRRVIHEARPAWVVGENVAHFVNMALDDVCADLENENYEVQAFVIPAASVGAWHHRKRVFIVSYAREQRCWSGGDNWQGRPLPPAEGWNLAQSESERQGREPGLEPLCKTVSDPARVLLQGCRDGQREGQSGRSGWWQTEPGVGRVAHGLPAELDGYWNAEPSIPRTIPDNSGQRTNRIKGLGNAVVPQQVFPILKLIAILYGPQNFKEQIS